MKVMFDIITEKQKDNVAKFLYDVTKITLATLVLSPFTNKEPMEIWVLIVGILVTFISFVLAFNLDKKEVGL